MGHEPFGVAVHRVPQPGAFVYVDDIGNGADFSEMRFRVASRGFDDADTLFGKEIQGDVDRPEIVTREKGHVDAEGPVGQAPDLPDRLPRPFHVQRTGRQNAQPTGIGDGRHHPSIGDLVHGSPHALEPGGVLLR